jgi:hypothetical protein
MIYTPRNNLGWGCEEITFSEVTKVLDRFLQHNLNRVDPEARVRVSLRITGVNGTEFINE